MIYAEELVAPLRTGLVDISFHERATVQELIGHLSPFLDDRLGNRFAGNLVARTLYTLLVTAWLDLLDEPGGLQLFMKDRSTTVYLLVRQTFPHHGLELLKLIRLQLIRTDEARTGLGAPAKKGGGSGVSAAASREWVENSAGGAQGRISAAVSSSVPVPQGIMPGRSPRA